MTNKKNVFLALVIFIGIGMVAADFLALLFFGLSINHILSRFGIPALGFLVVYNVIAGRSARYFTPAFFKDVQEDEFAARLKMIGATPIKLIFINIFLHAFFLGAIFFSAEYLGIEPAIRLPLFFITLAFGMFLGTFIYAAADGLVSRTLIEHDFVWYPEDFREKRQASKAFILPVAAIVTSVMFTCAITILSFDPAGTVQAKILSVPLAIFVVTGIGLAYTIKQNCQTLFSTIINQFENLSAEKKDLTRHITVCSVDELGTIAGIVNKFYEHLSGGIRDIKDGQHELSGVGIKLEKNASGMADSVIQIYEAAEQVLNKTHSQLESANTSSNAVQQISMQIKRLEESIFTQTSSITEASAAVEEMVGNISSIGTITEKMASQFKTVGEASNEGSRIQKENGERIRVIVEQSQALQDANKIIAAIAASTNLLAMNAAIEAAHAGEAGRGFAVVADEIRKLAESSASESKKIGSELKQIVVSIEHIVRDAAVTESAFSEVTRRIDETGKLVHEVDNGIREQRSGAAEVIDSLKVMNELTMKVKDGSQEMDQSSEAMVKEIGTLQSSAKEIQSRMEEISGGIKNINNGAQEVSGLAAATYSSIEKIGAIADGFEV